MNKTIIIFLAVCLITVHAFVKRDAPTQTNDNGLDSLQKTLEGFANSVKENFSKVINPDNIQKQFNDAVSNVKQALDSITPKPAT
ncbi:unnamed protein product [Leptosia nina]|uniref:Uncharacterized protein n=1 Tax=Leptosia nina TaxID=320188 RepID=A0AAV1J4W1_9NEOP